MNPKRKAQAEWFLQQARDWRRSAAEWAARSKLEDENPFGLPSLANNYARHAAVCEVRASRCFRQAEELGAGPEKRQQALLREALR